MVFDTVKKNQVKIIEAASRGVMWNKVFLKMSQILKEHTCVVVSFFKKRPALWPETLLKGDSNPCEYSDIFKNSYLEVETLENEIY